MENNHYIKKISHYVMNNTPVNFIFHKNKYYEFNDRLVQEHIINEHSELLCASYSLFYTTLSFHKRAETDSKYQPYDILLGDYISSYVAELLYKNQLIDILKVFTLSSKKIMLNILNNNDDDSLLDDIIKALKSR